jgi:hypothetical protein
MLWTSTIVGVDLDMYVWVRYVFLAVKIRQKPKMQCRIRIPVKAESSGTSVVSPDDRCRVEYRQ